VDLPSKLPGRLGKKNQAKGSNICVIGSRAAGKTTYLAALADWPQVRHQNITITPVTEDAKKLQAQVQNKMLQKIALAPTQIDGIKIKSFYDLPLYQFRIESQRFGGLKTTLIDLVVRDYPGEIFDDLADGISKPVHDDFLNECFVKDTVGCLVMLHEWEIGRDNFYRRGFEQFINLMDNNDRLSNFRLAVVMSKCERGELWPGRLDPEMDIFRQYLPKTTETLRHLVPKQNLRFYALSTFGVLSRNDPRPNRQDEIVGGKGSLLRESGKWQPYGMMSPLYWLSGS
jgi:hypothetical protein